jgi:hypothetical protein
MASWEEKPMSVPVLRVQLIQAAVWFVGLYVAWDLGHALIKVLGQ